MSVYQLALACINLQQLLVWFALFACCARCQDVAGSGGLLGRCASLLELVAVAVAAVVVGAVIGGPSKVLVHR